MSRRYFFREGDFFKWHRAYLECKDYPRACRTGYSAERKNKESLQIAEEYRIFICSLSEDDAAFTNESIGNGHFLVEGLRKHHNLLSNWDEMVLRPDTHSLDDVDIEALGSRLKEQRKDEGMNDVYPMNWTS